MGYQVYEDITARDHGVERWAGYGVPAICDLPGCTVEIDRGMGYRCEEWTDYEYRLEGETVSGDDDWDEELEVEREGCGLHFCDEHLDHPQHGDGISPKPDTEEWMRWILTDESWQDWRDENPQKVEQMRSTMGVDHEA